MTELLTGRVKYQIVPHSTKMLNDEFMLVSYRIIPPRPHSGVCNTGHFGKQNKEIRIYRHNDSDAFKTRFCIENQKRVEVFL